MNSGNGYVPRRRTRQQTLKYMVELIEKRNKLSQSANSTNVSCGRKRKMMEPSGGDKRNVENNRRRKFSPGACESSTNQPFVNEISDDDDSPEEVAAPMLNATDEVVSSTSTMCRTAEKSESSTDEDNDDPKDKSYRAIESSTSDDITSDFDLRSPKENEKGKKESNRGLVPQKHKKGRGYLLRLHSLSMSKKKMLNNKNCSSPILISEDEEESKTLLEDDCEVDESVKNVVVQKVALRKNGKKILDESEFLKFIVDSIINVDDHNKLTSSQEKEQVPVKETLPLVFRFEDEEPLPPEKEEWEKENDNLFGELDMCIEELNIGFTNPSDSLMESGQIDDCQMGNHQLVLDEQIGHICSVCSYVHLENKYIFPPFAQRTRGRCNRKYCWRYNS